MFPWDYEELHTTCNLAVPETWPDLQDIDLSKRVTSLSKLIGGSLPELKVLSTLFTLTVSGFEYTMLRLNLPDDTAFPTAEAAFPTAEAALETAWPTADIASPKTILDWAFGYWYFEKSLHPLSGDNVNRLLLDGEVLLAFQVGHSTTMQLSCSASSSHREKLTGRHMLLWGDVRRRDGKRNFSSTA